VCDPDPGGLSPRGPGAPFGPGRRARTHDGRGLRRLGGADRIRSRR
jgi:hypothetical protein